MNIAYQYSDIVCPDCDGDDTTDGQNWPYSSSLQSRRSLPESDSHTLEVGEEWVRFEYDGDHFIGDLHQLPKRRAGTATLGPKKVTVGPAGKVSGPKYPSFPQGT